MTTWMTALCLLPLVAAPLRAQTPTAPAAIVVPDGARDVWKRDEARRAAIVAGDVKALAPMLADDLTYTHSSGKVDTKESLLTALSSGAMDYDAIDYKEAKVQSYRNTVVIAGVVQVAARSGGQSVRFDARFTAVWAKVGRDWRFVAWQTTRLPAP